MKTWDYKNFDFFQEAIDKSPLRSFNRRTKRPQITILAINVDESIWDKSFEEVTQGQYDPKKQFIVAMDAVLLYNHQTYSLIRKYLYVNSKGFYINLKPKKMYIKKF